MRNSKVIREEIGEVKTSLDALENLVSDENRDFSEEEKVSFDTNMERLTELVDELPKVEKEEEIRMKAANLGGSPVVTESKEEKEIVREFSFGKAVRAAFGGKLDGVELEMAQEGQKEMTAIGRSANGVVIPSMILNRAVVTENGTSGIETQSFVDAVYANTILDDLGVTRVSSTTDQRIPILGAVTTQWEGETDAAADGGSAMSKKDLAPKRLASFVDFSKQAAMQHNESLESALRNSIAQAVGAKVEYALFTDDSANGSYDYLGNGKTPVTNANITNLMMALVEEVQSNNHNRGNLGFAISNDLFSEVYTAAQVSGVNPLIINEMIMGVMAKFSNQIADITNPAVYYGDFSKVQIAQFGGVEILVDPYTQAVSGTNRLILNSYWDAALVQDAAISVGGYTG
jgi:HK97 family phage major capsid protein